MISSWAFIRIRFYLGGCSIRFRFFLEGCIKMWSTTTQIRIDKNKKKMGHQAPYTKSPLNKIWFTLFIDRRRWHPDPVFPPGLHPNFVKIDPDPKNIKHCFDFSLHAHARYTLFLTYPSVTTSPRQKSIRLICLC